MVMDCLSSSGSWNQSPSVVMQALQSGSCLPLHCLTRAKLSETAVLHFASWPYIKLPVQEHQGAGCLQRLAIPWYVVSVPRRHVPSQVTCQSPSEMPLHLESCFPTAIQVCVWQTWVDCGERGWYHAGCITQHSSNHGV